MDNAQLELELPPTVEELNEVFGFGPPQPNEGNFSLKAPNGQMYLFEVRGSKVNVYRRTDENLTREVARTLWGDLKEHGEPMTAR
jgi:hypothetical protein